ncbi:hypothetical protein L798_09064 [Zootermopsis nevadensis]|uniref:Uncharacterized protein n=1 Tax=Zootermopsis nevadensis TaxID=136037 RepID=A0A067RBC1_ZOONE|nr:hypothetical protein L798_09064 [Zootermopsis nevadensis]
MDICVASSKNEFLLGFYLLSILFRRAKEEFRRINFPDRYPAFNGRKNLYSTRELPEVCLV